MVRCRNCADPLSLVVLDLGTAPPSNAYLSQDGLAEPEVWLPLRVMACQSCWLVQTQDVVGSADVFTDDYAYFSSTSQSWMEHARRYVASVVDRFGLGPASLVMEVAANDGYLLQFVQERGIRCVGVEPTSSTAAAARAKGLAVEQVFLGESTAREIVDRWGPADLVVANNVIAHVPDLNDFIKGLRALLGPGGVLTIEFPTVTNLVDQGLFDTVYHEHFSYFGLSSVVDALARRGLVVFDVEPIRTHGGSLRVFAQHAGTGRHPVRSVVAEVLAGEARAGVMTTDYYATLQSAAESAKMGLLEFLLDARRAGHVVAGYGAAAKGNTLLNFAGVRRDLLSFVCDRSPGKVGKFLPGSRIPILEESVLTECRPDVVLLLPWNLRGELEPQLGYVREWGARLAVAVPSAVQW